MHCCYLHGEIWVPEWICQNTVEYKAIHKDKPNPDVIKANPPLQTITATTKVSNTDYLSSTTEYMSNILNLNNALDNETDVV